MAEKGVAAAYGALSQALLLLVPSLQRQLVLLNPSEGERDVQLLCKTIVAEVQQKTAVDNSSAPHLRRICSNILSIRNKYAHQAYDSVNAIMAALQRLQSASKSLGDQTASDAIGELTTPSTSSSTSSAAVARIITPSTSSTSSPAAKNRFEVLSPSEGEAGDEKQSRQSATPLTSIAAPSQQKMKGKTRRKGKGKGKGKERGQENDKKVQMAPSEDFDDITLEDNLVTLDEYRAKAKEFFSQDRYREAIGIYNRALEAFPEEAVLYSNRAICEIKLGHFDLAREDAEDAIELASTEVKYYLVLCDALVKLRKWNDLESVAKKGLELAPTRAEFIAHLRDANGHLNSERNDNKAEMPIEMALKKSPAELRKDLKNEDVPLSDIEDVDGYAYARMLRLCLDAHSYYHGILGKPKDEMKAFKLYSKASDLGSLEGKYNLVVNGLMRGQFGITPDYPKGVRILKELAEFKPFIRLPNNDVLSNIGVPDAQNSLGCIYRDGKNVDIDDAKSFSYFLRAAKNKHNLAMNSLGVMYFTGRGTPLDFVQARYWFKQAYENNVIASCINYAGCLHYGQGGPVDKNLAVSVLERGVSMGDVQSINMLQQLQQSAELGIAKVLNPVIPTPKVNADHPLTAFHTGMSYLEGLNGCKKDETLAEKHLRVAADKGHRESQYMVGVILGDRGDLKESFQYFLQAAENGFPQAQAAVSERFAWGAGCSRDTNQAEKWAIRAKIAGEKVPHTSEKELIEKVLEFERMNRIDSSKLSISRRLQKYLTLTSAPSDSVARDQLAEMFDYSEKVKKLMNEGPELSRTVFAANEDDHRSILEAAAKTGSMYAKRILELNGIVRNALSMGKGGRDVVHLIAVCCDEEPLSLSIEPPRHVTLAVNIATMIYEEDPTCGDAAVIIAYHMNGGADVRGAFLETAIKKCTKSAPLYRLAASIASFRNDLALSVALFEKALALYENVPSSLYYDIAGAYRLHSKGMDASFEKATAFYLRFLKECPEDGRKVSEAYYCLGELSLLKKDFQGGEGRDVICPEAVSYYEKGIEAEKKLIRIYPAPSDNFPPKGLLKHVISISQKSSSVGTSASQSSSVSPRCHSCGKSQNLKPCRCHAVFYCDVTCQKKDWPNHKLACSAASKK